jgi:hypothetical protein
METKITPRKKKVIHYADDPHPLYLFLPYAEVLPRKVLLPAKDHHLVAPGLKALGQVIGNNLSPGPLLRGKTVNDLQNAHCCSNALL